MRHAKSSWKEADMADHDRPLNARGERDAAAMGKRLAEAGVMPDLVLCSTAARTRATLALMVTSIKPAKVVFESTLYAAGRKRLLHRINDVPEDIGCVLLIGHNPGLQELALTLADAGSTARLPPVDGKYPTAAIASFQFDGEWRRLEPHEATVVSYLTPC
jgi:phosphohistidine phosphatase